MKNTVNEIWTMVKIALAYACALIGMVIGIPANLLAKIGYALVELGNKIAGEARVDGVQIVNEIIDMDV